MAQIVAEELQIPYERVTVSQPDTDTAPFSNPTGGSRVTYSLGTAVHRAAVDARTKLKQRAAQQLKAPPDEVEYRQGQFWVRSDAEQSLTLAQVARGAIGSGEGPVIGTGEVTHLLRAPAFATQIIEVEVDQETGLVQVVKATAVQDVGCAINPTACEGQIQGGVVQAIGWALMEEYVYDDHGRLRNPSLLDYRMPTALDAPNIECVLVEVPAADGPYGVRGTGEVPIIPGPAAIAAAVHDAIGARVNELPVSGERVLAALAQAEGGANGKAAPPLALTSFPVRSAADVARQSVLRSQAGAPAGGAKLAVESDDYGALEDVAEPESPEGEAAEEGAARYGKEVGGEGMAEAREGAHGTAHPTPTPRTGAPAPGNASRPGAAADEAGGGVRGLLRRGRRGPGEGEGEGEVTAVEHALARRRARRGPVATPEEHAYARGLWSCGPPEEHALSRVRPAGAAARGPQGPDRDA